VTSSDRLATITPSPQRSAQESDLLERAERAERASSSARAGNDSLRYPVQWRCRSLITSEGLLDVNSGHDTRRKTIANGIGNVTTKSEARTRSRTLDTGMRVSGKAHCPGPHKTGQREQRHLDFQYHHFSHPSVKYNYSNGAHFRFAPEPTSTSWYPANHKAHRLPRSGQHLPR
jgi:hypothetical protein